MHQKSSLPAAEVTVLPIRPSVAGQGEGRLSVVPIVPQVSALAKGSSRSL
jgi:hypothetical protein